MSRGWTGGSTRAWRKTRALVLLRDGGLCQIRRPGTWIVRTEAGYQTRRCLGVADCVHHTRGRGVTGDDMAYMQAACTPCNLKVGDPTAKPARSARPVTRW